LVPTVPVIFCCVIAGVLFVISGKYFISAAMQGLSLAVYSLFSCPVIS